VCAGLRRREEIASIADAAGADHGGRDGCRGAQASDGIEIGAGVAADLIERHCDDACGPAARLAFELARSGRGADELACAVVERQNRREPIGKRRRERGGFAQRFGPEDGDEPRPRGGRSTSVGRVDAGERRLHRRIVREARVEPYFDIRHGGAQGCEGARMIAAREDRIEVGDVECAGRGCGDERPGKQERLARRGERRANGAVVVPTTAHGVHGLAVEQVENRYDQHGVMSLSKIFVYEYLTGGGIDPALARESGLADLSALIGEGRTMRDALVRQLRELDGVQVSCASSRFETAERDAGYRLPKEGESIPAFVGRMAREHDHVWAIAPECDGLLLQLHDAVGAERWLGCSREAIAVASSKRATARCLAASDIATTQALAPADVLDAPGSAAPVARQAGPWVVKPDDGAGGLDTFLFDSLAAACAEYDSRAADGRNPVLQAWVDGEPLSLSLICREDGAQLVSINRQRIEAKPRRAPGAPMRIVEFLGVDVGHIGLGSVRGRSLAALARRIGHAMPGLRGFVGIDLVWHPARGPVVIEVNPRLTLAYAELAAGNDSWLTEALLAAYGVRRARPAGRALRASDECEARP